MRISSFFLQLFDWLGNKTYQAKIYLAGYCVRPPSQNYFEPSLRVHNRFGGMQDLAIFRGDTRDAS